MIKILIIFLVLLFGSADARLFMGRGGGVGLVTPPQIPLPTFQLQNSSASVATGVHELRFAEVFKQGAAPSGTGLAATINSSPISAQLDCKTKYPDNSCKHGFVSLNAPNVPTSTTYNGTLALTAGGGTPINLASLPGSGYTLSSSLAIQGGSTYTVNWMTELTSALGGSTCTYWQQGPIVSECRVNKDLEGSLHQQADIAYWADGSVKVDLSVKNDYAFNSSNHYFYNYTVTQNSVVVVNLSNVQQELYTTRHDIIWSNGAPKHLVQRNCTYLKEAGATLPYDCSYNQALASPGQPGGLDMTVSAMNARMANACSGISTPSCWGGPFPFNGTDYQFSAGGGSHPELGLHTAAQTLWLMVGNQTDQDYSIQQSDISGSIPWNVYDKVNGHYYNTADHPNSWFDGRGGQFVGTNASCGFSGFNLNTNGGTAISSNILHFSDTTGVYVGLRLADYSGSGVQIQQTSYVASVTATTITLNQNVAGTVNSGDNIRFGCFWEWGNSIPAHPPEFVALPYMFTGDRYILDELNAIASWAILDSYPPNRQFNPGKDDTLIDFTSQMRQQAWSFRNVEEAAYLNPDGSYEQTYFQGVVTDNITYANTQTSVLQALQGDTVYGWVGSAGGIGSPPTYILPAYYTAPPWEEDYFSSAIANAITHGLNVTAAKAFYAWFANWKIGIWTTHSGWDRRNGQMYYMAFSDGSGNYAQTYANLLSDSVGHTPCSNNDCSFANTGWVNANYAWLGATSCALISYTFGLVAPGPAALDCYNYISANIQNYTPTDEPQYQFKPN